MIIGIDAYHESKKRMSSVIGFVASMNASYTRWFSTAIIHKSTHQEFSPNLHVAMNKALYRFKKV